MRISASLAATLSLCFPEPQNHIILRSLITHSLPNTSTYIFQSFLTKILRLAKSLSWEKQERAEGEGEREREGEGRGRKGRKGKEGKAIMEYNNGEERTHSRKGDSLRGYLMGGEVSDQDGVPQISSFHAANLSSSISQRYIWLRKQTILSIVGLCRA